MLGVSGSELWIFNVRRNFTFFMYLKLLNDKKFDGFKSIISNIVNSQMIKLTK